MTVLLKQVRPANGAGAGKVFNILINPESVLFIHASPAHKVGNSRIELLGTRHGRSAAVHVNATVSELLRDLGLAMVAVKPYDLPDVSECHVVLKHIRLVTPASLNHDYYIIEFNDDSTLAVERPDDLLAMAL